MLRSDAGIIQSGGNGVCQLNVSVVILQQVGTHAMQYARLSFRHGAGVLTGLDTKSGCLHADQFHFRIVDEVREHTDGVGTAADAGHNDIRKLSFLLQELAASLTADNTLEFLYHLRVGMRAYGRTDDIEGILSALRPGADGFVGCILQGVVAGGYADHFRSQKLHAEYIQRLALDILRSHVYGAFHVEKGCAGCSCHAVLTGSGLRNDTGFSHFLRQQYLTEHVVDLMRTGMVQILAASGKPSRRQDPPSYVKHSTGGRADRHTH